MTAIDRAYLAEQTAGDEDLATELLGLFAAQCRRLAPALAERRRDPIERADLAHTLKGSALGVGAHHVAERAATVETALREGREPETEIAALGHAVAEALTEIGRAA